MKNSTAISVGHAVNEAGGACAFLLMDEGCNRAALSAAGARIVAMQLLQWADHVDAWTQSDDDTRKQEWIRLKGETVKTMEWVAVVRGEEGGEPDVSIQDNPP